MLVARGRRVSLLLVRERSRGLLDHESSRATAIRARDGSGFPVRLGRWCATIASILDTLRGMPSETGIPRFWDSVVPIGGKTGEDTVYSSIA